MKFALTAAAEHGHVMTRGQTAGSQPAACFCFGSRTGSVAGTSAVGLHLHVPVPLPRLSAAASVTASRRLRATAFGAARAPSPISSGR